MTTTPRVGEAKRQIRGFGRRPKPRGDSIVRPTCPAAYLWAGCANLGEIPDFPPAKTLVPPAVHGASWRLRRYLRLQPIRSFSHAHSNFLQTTYDGAGRPNGLAVSPSFSIAHAVGIF